MTFSFSTIHTTDFKSILAKFAFHFGFFSINKTKIWNPIHANDMCPNIIFLVNAFHHSLQIIAQETTYFGASLIFLFHKLLTSIAIPLARWNLFKYATTIASLMSSSVAKITKNYLIFIFIFLVQTDVTLDLIIIKVFLNNNFCIRI
jgi:hypothetical protein